MPRFLLSTVAMAVIATSAQAAPGFGGSVSDERRSAKAFGDSGRIAPLAYLVGYVGAKLSGKAGAQSSETSRDAAKNQPECEEAKEAEAKRAAETKSANPGGPEPLYLAF